MPIDTERTFTGVSKAELKFKISLGWLIEENSELVQLISVSDANRSVSWVTTFLTQATLFWIFWLLESTGIIGLFNK